MDKQYSVEFFTSLVESIQKCCRDFLEFDQAIELSGYLNLEIDNYKKERYVLSEMMSRAGDVISESYCTKAFKTVHRNRSPPPVVNTVLRDSSNQRDGNVIRGRNSPGPPDATSRMTGGRRHFGLTQRHHYLSAFHPGKRRNLIQNRRSTPSASFTESPSYSQSPSHNQSPSHTQSLSYTQSSSYSQNSTLTQSSSLQSKDAELYDIQARTSMAMTFNPTDEVISTVSFADDSLKSSDVKSVLAHQDGSHHSKGRHMF